MANTIRTSLSTLAQGLGQIGRVTTPSFPPYSGHPGGFDPKTFQGERSILTPGVPLVPLDGENEPRQFQYQVGQNLILQPRMENSVTGKPGLTPFPTLRNLADMYDLVRIAIETRKEEISAMEWDIVPEDEAVENTKQYAEDIKKIKSFFEYPDKTNNFYDWLGMLLEDVLVVDALSIFKNRTRSGKLYALEPIDGSTIKPLLNVHGRVPAPPDPAFQQVLYGYTRIDLTNDQLIYKPKNKRTFTPYGFSPVEYVIIAVNMGLRRQNHYLSYYTDGSLPDGGIYGMPEGITIDQVKQFQDWWDSVLAGNSGEKQRMRFLPGGGTFTPTKSYEFKYDFDEWLATIVCAAFGVNPMIFKKQMNRATALVQDGVASDVGLKPMQIFLGGVINQVIKQDLGMPHLKFKWIEKKQEDEKLDMERNEKYVKAAIYSIDDVLDAEGREKIGIPRFVMTSDGPVFLTPEYVEAKIAQQMESVKPIEPQQETLTEGGKKDGQQQEEKEPGKTEQDDEEKKVNEELKRFEKFSLKKKSRGFESEIIPAEILNRINNNLQKVTAPEDIRILFKQEREKESLTQKFKKALVPLLAAMGIRFMGFSRNYEDNPDLLLEQVGTFIFLEDEFQNRYEEGIGSFHEAGYKWGARKIGQDFKEYPRMRAAEWAKSYAGERIKQVEQATKDMIRATIESSLKNGEDWHKLKRRLEENHSFSPARAEVIARTESANAYNTGAVHSWQDSGLVDTVTVSDGTDFDEPCQIANGQIWTFQEALERPTEHPNCTREFTPNMKEGLT
jgi:hypothetical protein